MNLTVSGMTCGHCATAVRNAVTAVPGTSTVAVDLASGRVTVTGTPDEQAVRHAITEEGYEVHPA